MGRSRYILERKEHSMEPWDTRTYSRGQGELMVVMCSPVHCSRMMILFLRKNGIYKQETV